MADYLGISTGANQEEISKAYRKKGKAIHPDKAKQAFIASRALAASKTAKAAARAATSKAKADGTSVKAPKPTAAKPPTERELRAVTKKATEDFARLGLINKILQGPDRERYDHFLQNGFPAWRGTGYYYTRYRPGGGTVLFGLFVFAGGAVHYLVLILSWKRQRDFVQRYIQQARKLAWGEAGPIAAIPGISTAGEATTTALPSAAADELAADANPASTLNRRERRAQEKAKKKPSAKDRAQTANSRSGTATPAAEQDNSAVAAGGSCVGPVAGPRKRVQAENGKTLVVDSAGNVFLEEIARRGGDNENQDSSDDESPSEPQLFLLDADEMPRPTIRDTMVCRLPVWAIEKAKSAVFDATSSGAANAADDAAEDSNSPNAQRRRKVPRKPKPGQVGSASANDAVGVVQSSVVSPTTGGVAVSASSSGDDEVDGFVAVGEQVAAVPGANGNNNNKKKKNNNNHKKGKKGN